MPVLRRLGFGLHGNFCRHMLVLGVTLFVVTTMSVGSMRAGGCRVRAACRCLTHREDSLRSAAAEHRSKDRRNTEIRNGGNPKHLSARCPKGDLLPAFYTGMHAQANANPVAQGQRVFSFDVPLYDDTASTLLTILQFAPPQS